MKSQPRRSATLLAKPSRQSRRSRTLNRQSRLRLETLEERALLAIVVDGYDAARTTSDWGITEPYMADLRSFLTNPANFGPAGTVNLDFDIGPGINVATPASLAGVDVFFTGYVTTSSYTPAEKTDLYNYVLAGGALIATTDHPSFTMVDIFGVTQGSSTSGAPLVNTVTNPTHPVVNGPFGVVSTYQQWFTCGSYSSLGA